MKKLLALPTALLFSIFLFAQGPVDPEVNQNDGPSGVIKTNVLGLAFLSVNLSVEVKTGENTSVGLLAGYKLPQTYSLDAIGTSLDGEVQTYNGDIEPKGLYVNPYFRFYTNGALQGFYLEAFARFYDYEYLVPYEYQKNNQIINANLDGTASGFGGGIALGTQIPLASQFYIDIYAGFGVAQGSARVETNDPNLDAEDFQEIQETMEEYKDADIQIFIIGNVINSLEPGSNDTSAWGEVNDEIFPLIRGGICFGIAF